MTLFLILLILVLITYNFIVHKKLRTSSETGLEPGILGDGSSVSPVPVVTKWFKLPVEVSRDVYKCLIGTQRVPTRENTQKMERTLLQALYEASCACKHPGYSIDFESKFRTSDNNVIKFKAVLKHGKNDTPFISIVPSESPAVIEENCPDKHSNGNCRFESKWLMVIDEIPIELFRPKDKKISIYVIPPYGRVVIAAAKKYHSNEEIMNFAQKKIGWIKEQINCIQQELKRKYISGEPLYIWGKQYIIKFVPDIENRFILDGNNVILFMREESTPQEREKYVKKQLGILLKEEVKRLLPKWEQITGFHFDKWSIKDIRTWGWSCPAPKELCISLNLVHKPIRCLEYIIVHELNHFNTGHHDETFWSYMDLYMPDWRKYRGMIGGKRFRLTGIIWDKVVQRRA